MASSAMNEALDRFMKAKDQRDRTAVTIAECLCLGALPDHLLPQYQEERQALNDLLNEMEAIEKVQALADPKK